jgi:predicted  nucleic acid-binding Zn-ribbon protein
MTYDPDALRLMHDEAQTRIAELSTALSIVTDQRNNLEDSLQAAIKELFHKDTQITQLNSTVERLRVHIAQGIEL